MKKWITALWVTLVMQASPLMAAATISADNLPDDASLKALKPWQTLLPTPALPETDQQGQADINGIKIWYAAFGDNQHEPVVLVHESYGSANYWGDLVPELAKKYRVVVLDTRGHGRSTMDDTPLSIHLMAEDVVSLMDNLNLNKFSVVGWGDGANIGIDMAIHHSDRVAKLFAFGGNRSPSTNLESVYQSDGFVPYLKRTKQEYMGLSATSTDASYQHLAQEISHMWVTDPNFTDDQLAGIQAPTWVVDGDRDGAIGFSSDTISIAKTIPNAGLLIQPNVSHFALLEDPSAFNAAVLRFLDYGYQRAQ